MQQKILFVVALLLALTACKKDSNSRSKQENSVQELLRGSWQSVMVFDSSASDLKDQTRHNSINLRTWFMPEYNQQTLKSSGQFALVNNLKTELTGDLFVNNKTDELLLINHSSANQVKDTAYFVIQKLGESDLVGLLKYQNEVGVPTIRKIVFKKLF